MSSQRFSGQTGFYKGKVRDVYSIGKDFLVMVASDRISAFDVILPRQIPYKGQVLTQIASYMMQACSGICKNWLLETPAPNVSMGWRCEPIKLEMVVRGTLTGHAWRTYNQGKRILCGVPLPEGMKEHDFFENPIITPSTKAAEGHDEDISEAEMFNQQLTTEEDWEKLKLYSLSLFSKGREMALEKGLILADTKYEFGKKNGEIFLMDEIHTPDSSRYFFANGFNERQEKGQPQQQLSKEFVREWLIKNNFMGHAGQQVPVMTDAWVNEISLKYIQLYELITGKKFVPEKYSEEKITSIVNTSLQNYI